MDQAVQSSGGETPYQINCLLVVKLGISYLFIRVIITNIYCN